MGRQFFCQPIFAFTIPAVPLARHPLCDAMTFFCVTALFCGMPGFPRRILRCRLEETAGIWYTNVVFDLRGQDSAGCSLFCSLLKFDAGEEPFFAGKQANPFL